MTSTTSTARVRRIAGDIAATVLIVAAIGLLIIGALALTGLLGPDCQL